MRITHTSKIIDGNRRAERTCAPPDSWEGIKHFDTRKGIGVELRTFHQCAKFYDFGRGFTYGCTEYEVLTSGRQIGEVRVGFGKVCDYRYNYQKDEFGMRGLSGQDTVHEIEKFFPTEKGPKRMGIGGDVLAEVLKDCRQSGSAAVYCSTEKEEMIGLLRNRRFGFEKFRDMDDKFIKVLRKIPDALGQAT